jgi:hypothetical protein
VNLGLIVGQSDFSQGKNKAVLEETMKRYLDQDVCGLVQMISGEFNYDSQLSWK